VYRAFSQTLAVLILASASPRRARILGELGIPFRVVVSAVDETLLPGEEGAAAVLRLAQAKAAAVAAHESQPILAADTEVICDGEVLGKPGTVERATAMLTRLSGRSHEVVTAVCLRHGAVERSGVDRTRVRFAPMTRAECAWYAGTGEPLDKAGGYDVHGLGSFFIAGLEGSPSNVAGLPVRLFYDLARDVGLVLTGTVVS
jgi:septum formation protein